MSPTTPVGRRQPSFKPILIPLVLLLVLTAGSVILYLLQTAKLLDAHEIHQTIQLARSALNAELHQLGNTAYSFKYHNENGNTPLDTIGPKSFDSNSAHEIDANLLYEPSGDLRIAFFNDRSYRDRQSLENLHQKLNPLLDAANTPSTQGPKAATGLIRFGTSIYLVAVQAIQPESDQTSAAQRRDVLVLLREMDDDLLAKIAQEDLLPSLKLLRNNASVKPAQLPLTSVTGEVIGHLQWQPERLGRKLFLALAPAIPAPLILGIGLVIFFMRRMRLFFRERLVLYEQLKREKRQLEQNEATLRGLIEAIPSPFFFKNTKGVYLNCNQAFCNLLGLECEQIIGKTVFDLVPEDLAKRYHQADLELMEQGHHQNYETQIVCADGSRRDILFNKATLKNLSGEMMGLVGIMTDISEVKQAQSESQRLRHRLRNIIDSMPSMLITVDENQRVTEWNRWAAVASRVPARKALGRPLLEVFPELTQHHIDISEALNSGEIKTWPRISWKLHKRGVYVDLTVYPLEKGRNKGAVLRADNTTDRVQMEEVMVLSEKMLSIGSLAAGMAHEINNPLAIILQHSQILGNRLNPGMNKNVVIAADCGVDLDKLKRYLEKRGIHEILESIRQAGNRVRQIVDELVNFAQSQETIFSPCHLETLLEETLHLAASDYDLKKKYAFGSIKVERDIAENLPQLVCDRHNLQQVLLNLIRNSARALHTHPQNAPQITIKISSEKDRILIEVIDNGPGIPPTLLKRIFEPFFTTAPAGEGTGLGLSAAYFIIHEKHGGDIQVENIANGGCRFILTLPVNIRQTLPAE